MTGPLPPAPAPVYEICFRGHLSERHARWFEGLEMIAQADGSTMIRGAISDPPALYGLINRIRDLGLELISLRKAPEQAGKPE